MEKPEQLKHDLLELTRMQLHIDRNGGPDKSEDLFEEYFLLREKILESFGLPSKEEFAKIFLVDSLPTDLELNEKINRLQQVAQDYLLSPAKPELQILKDAQETKQSPFSILPELGISTHSYTIFIYNSILLPKRDKIENILAELKIANNSKILNALGNLEQGNVEKPQELIQILKENGFRYIEDFVKTFPKKEIRKEANLLMEFWSDINGGFEFKTLEDRFGAHTHYMMNYLCLVVGDHPYRITECEVYYYDKDNHPDPYVHKRNQQLFAGNWYFNDMGLDLTFGNHDKKIYASILIRGIRSLPTNQYISGPSKVLREIFDKFGNVLLGERGLCLREINQGMIKEEEPIQAVREGLTKKAEDTQNFIDKPYRYIVELNPSHKFSSKEKVVKQLLSIGKINIKEAKDILGYNVNL